MNIVIVGAGEVGTHLAKMLSREHHDIVLMDENPSKVEFAYGNSLEIMPIVGNPTSIMHLERAEVRNADLFIAVTPEESANIVSCMLAGKLGAKTTMARINNDEYLTPERKDYFSALGIDDMVYPESLAAMEIVAGLKLPWTKQYWSLFGGKLDMVAVRIGPYSPLSGKKLLELNSLDQKLFHILAIIRGNQTIIASGEDTIHVGDVVFVTAEPKKLDIVRRYCGQQEINVRNVIIMGGSRIALKTAELLPKDWNIKIIEQNLEKCKRLSEQTRENTLIIHGDGRDADLLKNENIRRAQAFLALTSNSESNMIATLNAKRLGVPRSVAQIENIDYLEMANQMGIGNLINKKLIAASSIYRHLLAVDISNAKTLSLGKGDVLEVIAKPGSKITKEVIKDLKLPKTITLGGYMHEGIVRMVEGNTQILPGDSIMIFSNDRSVSQIMKYFG